jgi:hypothetical protein
MKLVSESSVAIILVVLLTWFINPFGFWMNDMLHMTLLGLIVMSFALFAMFFWRESVKDEREQLHRYIGARFAYIVAGLLLMIGIIAQALAHEIDIWLPTVLAGMVLAKIIGRWYADRCS